MDIPTAPGKITRKKLSAGTYIYYEYAREYDKQKKFNIPRRACIGKLDPSEGTRMLPNEKYHDFFTSETAVEHDEALSQMKNLREQQRLVQAQRLLDAMDKKGKSFEEVLRLVNL